MSVKKDPYKTWKCFWGKKNVSEDGKKKTTHYVFRQVI